MRFQKLYYFYIIGLPLFLFAQGPNEIITNTQEKDKGGILEIDVLYNALGEFKLDNLTSTNFFGYNKRLINWGSSIKQSISLRSGANVAVRKSLDDSLEVSKQTITAGKFSNSNHALLHLWK